MPDLLWNDVRNFFDPNAMGHLPDLWVPDASIEDWQTVFDLVRSSRWTWKYREGLVERPLPAAVEVLPRSTDEEMADLAVRPAPGVEVIFSLMSATEIDFYISLRELQGQTGVDTLCAFLCLLGRRLGKPVFMSADGAYGRPVLGFDPAVDHVVLLADPVDHLARARHPETRKALPGEPDRTSELEPPGGIEPPTFSLRVKRSTD